MAKVSFEFKAMLDAEIGGPGHSACFQCGACVGDCPAATYSRRFNPRQIMLDAVLGLADRLICEDSLVWECTNCDNCYEHCPQDVRPVEVIQALKNMVHKAGYSPPPVQPLVESVAKMGRTTVVNDLILKRRKELGLPDLSEIPVDDLQTILNGKDS